jgi:hypothetical protein
MEMLMNIASNAIAIGVAASLTVLAPGCTHHVTEREYVPVPTPAQQPAPPQQSTVIDRVTVVQPPPPHEEMPFGTGRNRLQLGSRPLRTRRRTVEVARRSMGRRHNSSDAADSRRITADASGPEQHLDSWLLGHGSR